MMSAPAVSVSAPAVVMLVPWMKPDDRRSARPPAEMVPKVMLFAVKLAEPALVSVMPSIAPFKEVIDTLPGSAVVPVVVIEV